MVSVKKTGFDRFLELYPDLDLKEELTNAVLMHALDIPIEMVLTEKEALALSKSLMKVKLPK